MGRALRQQILDFIDEVPDHKLEGGLPSRGKLVWENSEHTIRLDMQGLTTAKNGKPQCYNLQVQMNRDPGKSGKGKSSRAARKAGENGSSLAHCEMPVGADWSAEEIKEALRNSLLDHGDKTGQV